MAKRMRINNNRIAPMISPILAPDVIFVAIIRILFLFEQWNDPQKYACADYGHNEFPQQPGFLYAHEAHEPAAEKTADDTQDKVDNEAETAYFHDFSSQESGKNADKDVKNDVHVF